ncbi:MAG: hypothetical protein ACJ761_05895 [Chloroflexota bacterium]
MTTRPAALTPDEEARAAALEAELVDQERQAETAQRRARDRGRRSDAEVSDRTGGSLAVRGANEYEYVARDVRRIVTVGGGLILLLVALWIVLGVTGATRI